VSKEVSMNALMTAVLAAAICVPFGSGCGGTQSFFSFEQTEEARRQEAHDLELNAGELLLLDPGVGDVFVEVATGGAAHLAATLVASAASADQAQAVIDRYRIEIVRTPAGASVTVAGEPLELEQGHSTMLIIPRVHMRASVPEGVRLQVTTGSGSIETRGALGACDLSSGYGDLRVEGANGRLRAETSSGSIEVQGVHTDSIELESGYGSIELSDLEAGRVRARTSSGSVRARGVRGDVELQSGYGALELERIDGRVDARTSSGTVLLSNGSGGPWNLLSGYGDVEVHAVRGELGVKTSSGQVLCQDFEGAARIESGYGPLSVSGVLREIVATTTSGRVSVEALPGSRASASWRLRSGYGTVELELPGDFDCNLDARTGYGSIESGFPIVMEAGKRASNNLFGTIGAGGRTVALETSSGDVLLRKLVR
jgi:DUF4097 and DUF4098 domain-containing protein YvlB